MSADPPVAPGTISRIGLAGYSTASAVVKVNAAQTAYAVTNVVLIVLVIVLLVAGFSRLHSRLTPAIMIRNDPFFRIYGIMITDMELRDLRYFAVVAEYRNIARAADALDLSATALGKSLRRLAKSVGAKLVHRAPGGIALTDVGAALLARIGPLQGMLNDVRHQATDLAQGYAGYIRVAAASGAPESFLADACVSLAEESPSIVLKASALSNLVMSSLLSKGELDFCVAGPDLFAGSEFFRERLHDDPFVVFASANHSLAKRKRVSISDIASERWAWVSRTFTRPWQGLLRAFEDNELPPPQIALESNSHAVRMRAVAYSNYLSITTREFLRQEAQKLPLIELPVTEMSVVRQTAIYYRRGAYISPASRRLIEILKAQAKGMSGDKRITRFEPTPVADSSKRIAVSKRKYGR